jgi:hypothetical protein
MGSMSEIAWLQQLTSNQIRQMVELAGSNQGQRGSTVTDAWR